MKSHGKQSNHQLSRVQDHQQRGQQETGKKILPVLISSLLFIRLVFVASIVAWSAVTIREPLWIDELHTLWSIQGDWEEVVTRSAAGNQSPLYFYLLKAYVEVVQLPLRIFGLDSMSSLGLILRSFSLIGWGLLAWLMSIQISSCWCRSESTSNGARGRLIAIFFVGGLWLMSDRTGGFYATEARPYVWVAVACGLMITKTTPTVGSSWRWLLYGVAAFYLHYTAIVVVAASFLLRSVAHYRNVTSRRLIFYEGFVLTLVMTPGLLHLSWLSKSSSQWAYFAGSSDLFTLLRISPWFAWVVMTAVFVGLASRFRWSDRMIATEESSLLQIVVWLAFICMVAHWSLCYFGWAPLIHSRYLIGTYPAIWIAGILLLKKLNNVRWIIAVGLLTMGVQGWLQGSWPLWGRGEWVAWQRVEDWDKAFEVLQQNKQADDVVFLAPLLIETEDQQTIDTSAVPRKRYFAFPIEALSIANGLVAPDPIAVLANSMSHWESTIEANFERMNYEKKSAWLLARTSQPWTIATASESKFNRELLYQAGNLRLWRLQLAK
ncbi:MAG: hypothetical protein NTW52_05855 [Planctomycetota bacterium]|nr:hypothetical protein [Planctomycetota bacterium]